MSEVNLDFQSNTVQANFSLTTASAEISTVETTLTLSEGPLTINVIGNGPYFTRAINANPYGYSDANLTITIPANVYTATPAQRAVAEYTLSGITESLGNGTAAVSNITFSGSTPVQGTVATNATATFTLTGTTPAQFATDGTAAWANLTITGNSSVNDGTDTTYTVELANSFLTSASTQFSVNLPAYGPYGANTRVVTLPSSTNSLVALDSMQSDLANFRPSLGLSRTNNVTGVPIVASIGDPASGLVKSGIATSGTRTVISYDTGALAGGFVYSNNLSTWTAATFNSTSGIFDYQPLIAYNGSEWAAIYSLGYFAYSTNGITWTGSSNFVNGSVSDIAGGTNSGTATSAFVAVGSSVWRSTNGQSWSTVTSGLTLNAVVFGNNTFIAVGPGGIIRNIQVTGSISTETSPVVSNLTDVAYYNGLYVAVGESGTIITNTTGGSWTQRTSGTSANFTFVYWAGDRWIAGSSSGTYRQSTDGITWTAAISALAFGSVMKTANLSSGVAFVNSTASGQIQLTSYNRLTIDTNYVSTTGDISAGTTGAGSNITPLTTTTFGTAGNRLNDTVVIATDTTSQSFSVAYSQTANRIIQDIRDRFTLTGWSAANTGNTQTLRVTSNTTGLLANAAIANISYSTFGSGGTAATAVSNRTAIFAGTNNTQNPFVELNIDIANSVSGITLPYATNLGQYLDYATLIGIAGYTTTQTTQGAFTLTATTAGVVSNISANIANANATTISRTAFANGSGTIPDPNTPRFTLTWTGSGSETYSPNPVTVNLPWNANAATIAQVVRSNLNIIGASTAGLGNSVTLTATSLGPQPQPVITKAGTGNANVTITNSFSNGTAGGSVAVLNIDGNAYPLPGAANPSESIVSLLQEFYSDTYQVIRTGASEFSIVAIQPGSRAQPNVSTTSVSQTLTQNQYTDGTPGNITIPAATYNLGNVAIRLPAIVLTQ